MTLEQLEASCKLDEMLFDDKGQEVGDKISAYGHRWKVTEIYKDLGKVKAKIEGQI